MRCPIRDGACLAVLLLLCAALWAPRLNGPADLRYDAGIYYILGTSLADGTGYRLANEPGAIEAVQYPPLLPALVAAIQWATGSRHPAVAGVALRWCFALLFVAYGAAVYALDRRHLPPGPALLAALVPLLYFQTTFMSDLAFAELPFALCAILFLLAAGSGGRRAHDGRAGVLAAASYLARSAGIAVLAAWVAESVLRAEPRRIALRAVLALLPIAAWQAHVAHVKGSDAYRHPAYPYQRAAYLYSNVGYAENMAYVDPFAPERGTVTPALLLARIAGNVARLPVGLGEAVSARAEWATKQLDRLDAVLPVRVPAWTVTAALGALGAATIAGLGVLATRGDWLIPLYVAVSLAVVSVTPWPGQFDRYLMPLTPVLALALLVALGAAARALAGRWRRRGLACMGAVVATMLGYETAVLSKVYTVQHQPALYADAEGRRHEYRLFFYPPSWRDLDQALDWLAGIAGREEIVATTSPHWAYLRTGLRAVMPPFEPDAAAAERLLEAVPVDYLVLDGLEFLDVSARYAAPVVRAFPERWTLLHSSPDGATRVYRRVPAARTR